VVSSISVSDAISKLTSGRGDGNAELTTGHFKYMLVLYGRRTGLRRV